MKQKSERSKQVWKAVGGTVAFLAVGLLLTPGFARREPAEPDPQRPARTDGPTSAQTSRSQLEESLADAGAWLDGAPTAAVSIDADDPDRAFDCMIGASEVVDVGSAITAVLDEILVERSDYVEAGQVVAHLDATVERAAVAVARARANRTDDLDASRTSLELSEKRLTRAHELFERDILSLDMRQEVETQADLAKLEVARAREDHRLAKLQLEQALANLERRTIRSPVAGVVVERLLSPGEVVDQEAVVRIAQVEPLRVEAILPGDWFGRMKPGDRAEIVPEAPLDQARVASVAIVDPVLEAASGTFTVELDLPNPDRALPAGLRCQVRFSAAESDLASLDQVELAIHGDAEGLERLGRPRSLAGLNWQPVALEPSAAR